MKRNNQGCQLFLHNYRLVKKHTTTPPPLFSSAYMLKECIEYLFFSPWYSCDDTFSNGEDHLSVYVNPGNLKIAILHKKHYMVPLEVRKLFLAI